MIWVGILIQILGLVLAADFLRLWVQLPSFIGLFEIGALSLVELYIAVYLIYTSLRILSKWDDVALWLNRLFLAVAVVLGVWWVHLETCEVDSGFRDDVVNFLATNDSSRFGEVHNALGFVGRDDCEIVNFTKTPLMTRYDFFVQCQSGPVEITIYSSRRHARLVWIHG